MSRAAAYAESGQSHDLVADLARRYCTHPSCITRHIIKGWTDKRTGEVIRPEGVVRSPGRWLIPKGSYERFLARIAAARQGAVAPADPDVSAARQRQLDRVERELAAAGF
jgi:hypothetical protein